MSVVDRIINFFCPPKLATGDLVWYDRGDLHFDRFMNVEPLIVIRILTLAGGLKGWRVAHVICSRTAKISIIDAASLKRWDECPVAAISKHL